MDRDRLNGQDIPLNKLDDIEVGDTLKKTLLIYGLFFFYIIAYRHSCFSTTCLHFT